VQTTVTTAANGEYQFTDLAAGTYRIQQKQPVAFINGGPNEIVVTLADGQALTDQNFRELGLRPEYVYNRLFTTLVMPVGSTAWTDTIAQIVTDAENGIMRAIRVTPPATSAAPALQTTSTIVSPPLDSDQDASAGELVETFIASSSSLSGGEAIEVGPVSSSTESDSITDDAIIAFASGWDDSSSDELALGEHDEVIPPQDQDLLLLALLAAENSDGEALLFDS
jgi:hypothetical protein